MTSVFTGAGGEGNLLLPTPEACRQIALELPILDNDELARIKQLDGWRGFKTHTLRMLFRAADGANGLATALESLFEQACVAIEQGANLIVLSDRGVTPEFAAIPSLLACSGLHHEMVRRGLRSRRPDHRMRRRPRGAPLRAPLGIWRRHSQPVSGIRDS